MLNIRQRINVGNCTLKNDIIYEALDTERDEMPLRSILAPLYPSSGGWRTTAAASSCPIAYVDSSTGPRETT